jgi:hypothetical protein
MNGEIKQHEHILVCTFVNAHILGSIGCLKGTFTVFHTRRYIRRISPDKIQSIMYSARSTHYADEKRNALFRKNSSTSSH